MTALYLHIQLLNYPHIRALYSENFITSLIKTLHRKLYISGATIYVTNQDSFLVCLPGLKYHHLEELQTDLLTTPLTNEGTMLLPVLSITQISAESFNTASLCSIEQVDTYKNSISPPQYTTSWRARYEHDMQIATNCLVMLEKNQAYLKLQPIKNIFDGETIYSEGLLGFNSPIKLNTEYDLFESFDNIGIRKIIDRYCLLSIIYRLEADSNISIGYNWAIKSLVLDNWWTNTLKKLEANRSIANRLIIEITLSDLTMAPLETTMFLIHLKSLGCKISLYNNCANTPLESINDIARYDNIKIEYTRIKNSKSREIRELANLIENFSLKVTIKNLEKKTNIALIKKLGINLIQVNDTAQQPNIIIAIRPLKSNAHSPMHYL